MLFLQCHHVPTVDAGKVESLHTRTRGKLLAISAPSSFLRLVGIAISASVNVHANCRVPNGNDL